MREEAEITERQGEERIRQRILTGTKRYLDRLAGLSERPLAGGPFNRQLMGSCAHLLHGDCCRHRTTDTTSNR